MRESWRLLESGADPNSHYAVEYDGKRLPQTCLYAAAGISNHHALTHLLLEAGADIDELVTAKAKSVECPPTVAELAEVGEIYPMEALCHACEFQDVSCVALLLERKPAPLTVSYCLGRAVDFRVEEAVRLFLSHGADPSMVVPWNRHRSHLHKAVMHGRSTNLVRTMLEAGANPNLPDEDGLSPHQHAVRQGETELAELLEEFGAHRARLTSQDIILGKACRGGVGSEGAAEVKPDPDRLVRAARRGDLAEIASLQYGGTPLGTCIYGSMDCFDEEGGPGACPPDEVPQRGYAQLAQWLIAQGATPPASIWGGSEAVQEVLRSHGVPDAPSD